MKNSQAGSVWLWSLLLGGETPGAGGKWGEETCQVSRRRMLLRSAAERDEDHAQYIAAARRPM
jgi:hypothetical protein